MPINESLLNAIDFHIQFSALSKFRIPYGVKSINQNYSQTLSQLNSIGDKKHDDKFISACYFLENDSEPK